MEDERNPFEDLFIFIGVILVLFIGWGVTGGPERLENKGKPFIDKAAPIGSGEVYGSGDIQYNQNIITEGIYAGWFYFSNKNFFVLLPSGWTQDTNSGFSDDSTEKGVWTNGQIDLHYEFGKNSRSLNFENNSDYIVAPGKVGGNNATFIKPSNPFGRVTGAEIRKNNRKKISVWTNENLSPSEEQIVFEIIQSIKF